MHAPKQKCTKKQQIKNKQTNQELQKNYRKIVSTQENIQGGQQKILGVLQKNSLNIRIWEQQANLQKLFRNYLTGKYIFRF